MKVNWVTVSTDGTRSSQKSRQKVKEPNIEPRKEANFPERLGLAAAQGFEPLASRPQRPLGGLFMDYQVPQETYPEQLATALNIDPESGQPRSVIENVLQRGLRSAPTTALFGGPKALYDVLAGSLAGAGAEQYGFSPETSDVLQNLTEFGSNIVRGLGSGAIQRLKNPASIEGKQAAKKIGPSYQESLYNQTQKLAETPGGRRSTDWLKQPLKSGKTTAQPLTESIQKVKDQLLTQTDTSIVNTVEDVIKTIENNVVQGRIKPNAALKLRRSINEQLATGKGQKALPYLQEFKDGIEEVFSIYSLKNPAYYNKLKEADKITALANYRPLLSRFVPDIADKIGGKSVRAVAEYVLSPFNEGDRLIRAMIERNPAAAKFYYNFFKGVAENNPAATAKAAQMLEEPLKNALTGVESQPTVNWVRVK